jgi:type IV pilus assembly protein PilC
MPFKIYVAVTKNPKTGKLRTWQIPAYDKEEVDLFLNAGIPQRVVTLGQLAPKRSEQLIKRYSKSFPLRLQVEFFEGLAPLIQVGFNPVKAFILQARATRDMHVRAVTMDIVHSLLSGELLFKAFARHANVFDETVLALVEEGESTGTLAETFEEIVRTQTKNLNYQRQLVSSMTYPIIVIIMAFVVTYIFTTILIPKIKMIYDNLHGELPTITRVVVGISTFLKANPWLLIGPIAFIVAWVVNLRRLNYQMWYCKVMLKIPAINAFLCKTAITRGCRALSVLLNAGVPMSKALTIAGRATGTIYFQKVFDNIREMINNGENMTAAFQANSDVFGVPGERLAATVESGEASGEMDQVLARLSKTFEREMEIAIDRLQQTIVPAVTIILAAFVGTIVFSIFLPLFGMGKVLMHATQHS